MKKIQRKEQSGRSMVEMLGVLAIIGVLSIGGVAGYRYAMDLYIKNRLLNIISFAALASQIERQNPNNIFFESDNFKRYDLFCSKYVGNSYCSQIEPAGQTYVAASSFLGGATGGVRWKIQGLSGKRCWCDNDTCLYLNPMPVELCKELVDVSLETYSDDVLIGFTGYDYAYRSIGADKIKKVICEQNGTVKNNFTGFGFVFAGNVDTDTTCGACGSWCPCD